MKRWTDRLIAIQFLIVVLPVTLVLVGLTVADARRAAALARSSPLEALGHGVRADYKTFENGVADAVDSGALAGSAAEALSQAAKRAGQLTNLREGGRFRDVVELLGELASAAPRGTALEKLLPLREKIKRADGLTQKLEDGLTAQNQEVLAGALRSASVERVLVPCAIALSLALTAVWVVRIQRRLRRRLAAEQEAAAANRRIKNALDNCSIGIMVADAERKIVYANASVIERLTGAQEGHLAGVERDSRGPDGAGSVGVDRASLESLLGREAFGRAGVRRAEFELGGRVFSITEDPVFDSAGSVVGYVLEWTDRTGEEALEEQVACIVEAASLGDFQQRVRLEGGARQREGTGESTSSFRGWLSVSIGCWRRAGRV